MCDLSEDEEREALLNPILMVCAGKTGAAALGALLDAVTGILMTNCDTVEEALSYLDGSHRAMRRAIAEDWAHAKIELGSPHEAGHA